MDKPLFSIIVVSLNPGDKLLKTIESIRSQTCHDYQVVVKDGGSKDGSLDRLRELKAQECQAAAGPAGAVQSGKMQECMAQSSEKKDCNCLRAVDFWDRVDIYEKPDKSIYEGMNQATKYAEGRYLYFLNCGDYFCDEKVLEQLKQEIRHLEQSMNSSGQPMQNTAPAIIYGDIYDALRGVRVASNPQLDGFGCYRNVPCHQACFYDARLFAERGYETIYRVRGDYEHFLWCFYVRKAVTHYASVIIASYEGGGFSETKENRKRSAREHKEITAKYMTKSELFRYRAILLVTLAPLRTKMAESPVLSGFYNRIKNLVYGRSR